MIDHTIDTIGTAILFVERFAMAPTVIGMVVAYSWLLPIPLGIWHSVVKNVPDEVHRRSLNSADIGRAHAVGQLGENPHRGRSVWEQCTYTVSKMALR